MSRQAAHMSARKSASLNCRHYLSWRCIDICALRIGAGTSAESGIPTFRGAGGLWRQYEATDLGTIKTINNRLVSRIPAIFYTVCLQRPPKPSLKTLHWSGSFTTGAVRFESRDGYAVRVSTPAGPFTITTILGPVFDRLCPTASPTRLTTLWLPWKSGVSRKASA